MKLNTMKLSTMKLNTMNDSTMFFGIDIETDDPHLLTKGASWVYGEGEVICVGLYDTRRKTKKAFSGNGGDTIKNLLLNPKVALIGANIVYDIGWLCHEHALKAKEIKCHLVDIAMTEACINEYQRYSLDELAQKYLKEPKQSNSLALAAAAYNYKGDFRKHLKKLFHSGHKKEIYEYVTSDAAQAARIWEAQQDVLPQESWGALITNFRLIKIVLDMKQRGVRINMQKKADNYRLLLKIQKELQASFEAQYGKVNFNSSKQLALLFDSEEVPYRHRITIKVSDVWKHRAELRNEFNGVRVEKGKLVLYVPSHYAERTNNQIRDAGYDTTCNPSIDKHALNKLKKQYAVAKAIVDLKQVTSIIDKFLGPNFDRFIVDHGNGNYRIHADFNIIGARQTGRFSSSNPNLQQVPSKTVLFEKTEKEIKLYTLCREVIIPDENMWMGKADYSGQENRLMAHFAVGNGSNEIRKKYNDNPELDYHQYMGEISGLYEEYGDDIGRKYAKNCAFGLGYGMQIPTMMATFNWSREEAERITALYHEGAPFIKTTMDRVSDVIVKRGYIRTIAGRHCHLQGGNKRDAYKGFNKLIQGSAADMTKKAMVDLDDKGLLDVFSIYLTVHDELIFGVPMTAQAIRRLPELQSVMENTFPLAIPIRVDPEIGTDWGHVKGRRKKEKKETKEIIVESLQHFIERWAKKAAVA